MPILCEFDIVCVAGPSERGMAIRRFLGIKKSGEGSSPSLETLQRFIVWTLALGGDGGTCVFVPSEARETHE